MEGVDFNKSPHMIDSLQQVPSLIVTILFTESVHYSHRRPAGLVGVSAPAVSRLDIVDNSANTK